MTNPEIRSLIGQLHQTDPSNLEERARVLASIRELRDLLEQGSTKESASFLEAASLLLEYIPPYGVEPNYLIEIVARLVSVADAQTDAQGAAPAAPAQPAAREPKKKAPAPKAAKPEAPAPPSLQVEPQEATPARPRGGLTKIRLSEGQSSGHLRLLNELLFGEVMLQRGVIDKDQLAAALRVQSATGKRLGEVLIETGAANYEQVQVGLKAQDQLQHSAALSKNERKPAEGLRPGSPRGALPMDKASKESRAEGTNVRTIADVMFGELLINLQLITADQLRKGLELQRATGNRIGETLVELNYLSWQQVQDAYALQRAKRQQAGIRT